MFATIHIDDLRIIVKDEVHVEQNVAKQEHDELLVMAIFEADGIVGIVNERILEENDVNLVQDDDFTRI